MSGRKTATLVLPMRRIRMGRTIQAVGIALRRPSYGWRRLWCLLSGRADRRAGIVFCDQCVVDRGHQ
jgi:hypothetical protein